MHLAQYRFGDKSLIHIIKFNMCTIICPFVLLTSELGSHAKEVVHPWCRY